MPNKKTESTVSKPTTNTPEAYLDYKVTPRDKAQYYNSKEVKVERIIIKFK